jgi:predicted amidophosphoribosyltransferase
VGSYVVIRDCLALSYVLDYDREEGNPDKPQTKVGALRSRAKTYDKVPTADTYRAADELVKECLDFLGQMTCYSTATCIVGMPPSRPDKPFDLPAYLAAKIAAGLGIPDMTHAVSTIKERPQLKGEPLAKKLEAIEATVLVDHHALKDQIVLLIDDLYQSGVSTNYVAMLMLEAGAKKVFGLACEKTCRNDDNIPRSSEK